MKTEQEVEQICTKIFEDMFEESPVGDMLRYFNGYFNALYDEDLIDVRLLQIGLDYMFKLIEEAEKND